MILSFQILVKDIKWKVILLTKKDYSKQIGKDSFALTDLDKKHIYFNEEEITLNTIYHELMHVYISSCCVDSTLSLKEENLEELCCQIIGDHITDILRKGRSIFKKLKTPKKELEFSKTVKHNK